LNFIAASENHEEFYNPLDTMTQHFISLQMWRVAANIFNPYPANVENMVSS
jgi:hypothetical protein